MKNKQKLKRKNKREVLRDMLRKNLKDLNRLPQPERGPAQPTKTSA
ncbi:hypothetical protein ACFPU1_06875 [Thalassorhabdus alkalitolerans]|uniref:Uncharacterized protein n=1 Tax=Thalassorhabdus alkalitolerans TaxID=2282697 RepID=A0ABW0YQ55_9BACI|nr:MULTISPECIES: hypothetical protein [Bacillaceae]